MSEAGTESSEADRLEQAERTAPDPGLAEEIGPEPVPVSAEQLAAGRDADPDLVEPDAAAQRAEESHDDGGPGDQHSG